MLIVFGLFAKFSNKKKTRRKASKNAFKYHFHTWRVLPTQISSHFLYDRKESYFMHISFSFHFLACYTKRFSHSSGKILFSLLFHIHRSKTEVTLAFTQRMFIWLIHHLQIFQFAKEKWKIKLKNHPILYPSKSRFWVSSLARKMRLQGGLCYTMSALNCKDVVANL